jgi:transposase
MNSASGSLPNDVAALRAMLLAAWAERDAERAETARLAAECDQLAGQNDRLRHLIRQLQRLRFGRRSEKLDPDQLALALEDIEQAIAETEAPQGKADPAFKRARAAALNTRSRCSEATPACCRSTPMPPTANSPIRSAWAAR